MTRAPAPAAADIPRWPTLSATLSDDGSGTLTIDGRTHKLGSTDIATARRVVLERAAATATTVGRPVRLNTTDPDGDWELAVHPDGRVDELDAHPAPAPATADTPAPITPPARRRSREPRQPARGPIARRLVVAAGLVIAISAATALVLTNGPVTVVRTASAPRPVSPVSPAVRESDVAAALAHAHAAAQRRAAARARRQRAVREHRVALRQAREQRAARRRAATQRSARNARRAAPRQRAATHERRPTPTAPAQPPTRPATPLPPTASSCGAFDLC
jgi:hypothetical protein